MASLMKGPEVQTIRFEDEARQVLSRVRRAFAGLLDALAAPGTTPRATDLQKSLGIPSTLAWRVHRVARAETPFSEVEAIPGAAAVQRVVKAAQKKALPKDRLDEVLAAIDAFESLVQDHAASRQTFNTMVASMGNRAEDTIDLATRKSAFVANSQIWGVQARTILWTGLYVPGSHDQSMHNGLITGAADIKRLHNDVRPHRIDATIGQPIRSDQELRQKRFGPVLLEEFSTQPLPIVDRSVGEDGIEKIDIRPLTMGNSGATTYFVTEAGFDIGWSPDDPADEYSVTHVRVSSSSESLVIDMLVHHGMFGAIEPKAAVFDGRDRRKSVTELLSRRRLPFKVEAAHLGRGLDAMHSADLPRYPAMVEDVCGRLGWDASQFDVYRCRVEYPIMSSITAMWFPLPEKGNW